MPNVYATIEIKLRIPMYVDDIDDVDDILSMQLDAMWGDNLLRYDLLDVEED